MAGSWCWSLAVSSAGSLSFPHGPILMASWASSEHGSWFPGREVARGRKQKLQVLIGPRLGSPRTLLLPHSLGQSHGVSLEAKEGEINTLSHWASNKCTQEMEALMAAIFGGSPLLQNISYVLWHPPPRGNAWFFSLKIFYFFSLIDLHQLLTLLEAER